MGGPSNVEQEVGPKPEEVLRDAREHLKRTLLWLPRTPENFTYVVRSLRNYLNRRDPDASLAVTQEARECLEELWLDVGRELELARSRPWYTRGEQIRHGDYAVNLTQHGPTTMDWWLRGVERVLTRDLGIGIQWARLWDSWGGVGITPNTTRLMRWGFLLAGGLMAARCYVGLWMLGKWGVTLVTRSLRTFATSVYDRLARAPTFVSVNLPSGVPVQLQPELPAGIYNNSYRWAQASYERMLAQLLAMRTLPRTSTSL
jgi:hypothetical protein